MVSSMSGNRDHCADDVLQVEARDVKHEPESVGHHPGIEDAWGVDRPESR